MQPFLPTVFAAAQVVSPIRIDGAIGVHDNDLVLIVVRIVARVVVFRKDRVICELGPPRIQIVTIRVADLAHDARAVVQLLVVLLVLLLHQFFLLEFFVDALDQALLGGGLEAMHRHVHLDDF